MWSYIKKAINSNLNKTLDVLVSEKHTATDNNVNGKVTTLTSHVTTKATEVNNNTNTARDNIKNHVTAEANRIQDKAYKASHNYRETILSSQIVADYNKAKKVAVWTAKHSGVVNIRASMLCSNTTTRSDLSLWGIEKGGSSVSRYKVVDTPYDLNNNTFNIGHLITAAIGTEVHTIKDKFNRLSLFSVWKSGTYIYYYTSLSVKEGDTYVFVIEGADSFNDYSGQINNLAIGYDEVIL